jgi:allantoin racemase
MGAGPLASAAPRRLLLVNPNTNPAVTERVRRAAAALLAPGTVADVANPASGPFSIETARHRDEAEPHVVALVRESLARRYDAYAFACFDDLALAESRRITGVPVVGTCEAGIAAVRTIARRFAIITTVHAAVPGIALLLARYGAADVCTIRAAGIAVAAAADGGDETEGRIVEAAEAAIAEDGAEALLLGSGGLTGYADALALRLGVPVVDGVAAAIKLAEAVAGMRSMARPAHPAMAR